MEQEIRKKCETLQKKINRNKTKLAVTISSIALICSVGLSGCAKETQVKKEAVKNKTKVESVIDRKSAKPTNVKKSDTKLDSNTNNKDDKKEEVSANKDNKKDTANQTVTKTTNSSNSNKSNNTSSQTPAHTHSWQPVMGSRTVVDQPAWTETQQVEVGSHYACNVCGATFKSGESAVVHCAGETNHGSYHLVTDYENRNINHPAQTHQEQYVDHYQCGCGEIR